MSGVTVDRRGDLVAIKVTDNDGNAITAGMTPQAALDVASKLGAMAFSLDGSLQSKTLRQAALGLLDLDEYLSDRRL